MNAIPRRRRRQAFTIIETVISIIVATTVLGTVISLALAVGRSNTRALVEAPMLNAGGTSVDELNTDLRGTTLVVSSFTASGSTYVSGTSSCALQAQAYNLALGNPIVTGVYDYIGLTYDSTAKQLLETISPGSGSTRITRTNFVMASNVSAATFTYYARDQFSASSASSTFTLSATPTVTPSVYVAGSKTTNFTYVSGTKQITVSGMTSGNDVEVVYSVSPTASSGADLAAATSVVIQFTQSQTDDLGVVRTVTHVAGTRIRNRRI